MEKMNTEQSASTGTSERTIKEEDDIIKLILNRINDFKDTEHSTDVNYYIPKLIVGFVFMSLLLLTYQINATSSYIGSGLRVPSHNVGIFVAKLISYRSFLMMFGFGFAYLIYYIYTLVSSDDIALPLTLKIISLFFFYLLLASRGCLLFSTFLTNNLSYRVYILLSIEAIPAGACQMSLILLVPQFVFITFLSIHLLAFIFFLSQFAFDLFLYNKPLIMIRIQFFMSLFVTIIAFGLWAFYLFYYYDEEPKSYKDELYKQNYNIEKLNSICQEVKDVSKEAKEIIKNILENLEDWLYSNHDITKEIAEMKSSIDGFLLSATKFCTLLKEVLKFILESKNKVEELYNKNKSDKDKEKDKKTFITQKSKYYSDKFTQKFNELHDLFNKPNEKKDTSNLFETSNSTKGIENTLKEISNNIHSKDNKELYEGIISLISEYNKTFEKYTHHNFNIFATTNNGKHNNGTYSELDEVVKKISDKINALKSIIENIDKKINSYESDIKEIIKLHYNIMNILSKKSDHIIFCYVMIAVACFFRDFLYPPIIPHALLTENEAQKILLLGIILQLFFCFPVFILDEILNIFTLLIERYFIYFWTIVGPPFIVLIFTFLAIHTKIRFFHVITESPGRVFTLSLFLIPFYTLMESVSYAYLSHYVFYHFGFSHKNLSFLLFHQLLEMFCTYFFSKLSAGYNHARVRLGHCLPTYTTNYEMDFWQELWSMIKWTLQYTFKDILFFFSTNIRQYL